MFSNLEAELRRKNIKRKDLAKKLNLTIGTISLKLNGKSPITLSEAKEIKSVLKVDIPLEILFHQSDIDLRH
ncbi:helix-turn-helix transcriptional regulator [Clostridium sp. YIM B02506]|uniref:helix-turn-helix domain-containing protein n=1 Tax=Clostridium sp. YIM B02506 TaxID=2910680 RepID=UPI001EEDF146|nr:helix-turn-helix transcriptional regulator [Clostridium sp. YIM B02506]